MSEFELLERWANKAQRRNPRCRYVSAAIVQQLSC